MGNHCCDERGLGCHVDAEATLAVPRTPRAGDTPRMLNLDKAAAVKATTKGSTPPKHGNHSAEESPIAPPKLSPRVQRMPRSPSSTRVRRKPPDQCWHCGEPSLSVCSQCLKAEYCSTNHQLLDWHARHAVECESLLKGSSPWQPDSGSPLRISSGLEAPEQRSNVMVSEIDDSALRYKVHKGMLLSKLHELDVRGLPWDDVCEQLESLTTEQRPLTAVFTDADGQHEVSHTFMTGPVRIKWAERSGGAQLVELERQLSIPTMQEEGVEFVGASDPDAGTFTESGSIKEKKKMGRCAC